MAYDLKLIWFMWVRSGLEAYPLVKSDTFIDYMVKKNEVIDGDYVNVMGKGFGLVMNQKGFLNSIQKQLIKI